MENLKQYKNRTLDFLTESSNTYVHVGDYVAMNMSTGLKNIEIGFGDKNDFKDYDDFVKNITNDQFTSNCYYLFLGENNECTFFIGSDWDFIMSGYSQEDILTIVNTFYPIKTCTNE